MKDLPIRSEDRRPEGNATDWRARDNIERRGRKLREQLDGKDTRTASAPATDAEVGFEPGYGLV